MMNFTFVELSVIVDALRLHMDEAYHSKMECMDNFRAAADASEPSDGLYCEMECADAHYRATAEALDKAKEMRARLHVELSDALSAYEMRVAQARR